MKVPVLIPKIFNHPFTYESGAIQRLETGEIVTVPFGKKTEIGVIWDKLQTTSKKIALKKIENKIGNYSINLKLIKFINWFSLYNLAPRGMVLKMCLGNKKNILNKQDEKTKNIFQAKRNFYLNPEQKKSLLELKKFDKKFKVSVLQGVTGSGKTIVYFEKIKEIINKKEQALILLPEIFLTKQFEARFKEFFGFNPAIWHSKISQKQKSIIWQNVIKNKISLVIGARSSLFLPFKKLGLIIVDEENDTSYKQDEGLIYNARDMAISRASFENVPIYLVSSIPSLETFNHINNKKYNHTQIKTRFKNFPLPKTKVVNINLSNKKKNIFIADETIELVKKFLDKKEQVLFFLNRRGYAPFLICRKCGYKHSCPRCSIYLTYHKSINKLICHYCGLKTNVEKKCKEKNSCDFYMYGPGVEKIFDELKKIFPKKVIKIFSSDFLKKTDETKDILKQIENNEINIIVGTQMISKGFNFPKLNCVVVVDADFSGKGYDLRTTEKNIQLYNQLSGRAGRFSNESLIIYQTENPSDSTLENLIQNNQEKFFKKELAIRRKNKLPPFNRLIALIVSSDSDTDSFRAAQEIKKKIISQCDFDVMGPVNSPIFKIKKKYRTRLLLRSKNEDLIQNKLSKVLQNLCISKKIKLTVDVDPINFS